MVQAHAQEGLLTARRFMWTPIAAYAWLCLVLRTLFQLPDWPTSHGVNSAPVLLGLRKVHSSAFGQPADYPPEMVFDAVILLLVVLQRRVFLSPDFQRVVDELWYAEQYDYGAHGSHVVNQLEKIREDALAAIRTQIRTMYEQLETVARARMEEADTKSWEHFLLKNRGNAARDSTSTSSPPLESGSPTGADGAGASSAVGAGAEDTGLAAGDEEQRLLLPPPPQQWQQQPPPLSPPSPAQQREPSLRGESDRDPLLLQSQQSFPSSASLDMPRRRRLSSGGGGPGGFSDGEITGRTGMINFSLTHNTLGDSGAGLRMTSSYDERTQRTRRLEDTTDRMASTLSSGTTGGSSRSGRARSVASEAQGLTQWVSDALRQSSLLGMKVSCWRTNA